MVRINLLPWRAEKRKERERTFYLQLCLTFLAAVAVMVLWVTWMDVRISRQIERNTYLQSQIKQLDDRIVKIKDLEKVRGQLLNRKQIIEQLQADRSNMVHLFDELVKTIPASVRLSALKQTGNSLTLEGVAQSNASVAQYMRNIEASPWMGRADLRKTENTAGKSEDARMPYSFGLEVVLNHPKPADGGDTSSSDGVSAAAANGQKPGNSGNSRGAKP